MGQGPVAGGIAETEGLGGSAHAELAGQISQVPPDPSSRLTTTAALRKKYH